jgi:hypothetical protein
VKERLRRFLILAVTLAVLGLVALAGIPYISFCTRLLLAGGGVALLIWLLWRAYRAFLWKVGRRLAFSYFLLGVLPIPLLLLLLAVLAYLLSGFFLGHLYRDAVQSMQGDLVAAAQGRLGAFTASSPPRRAEGGDVVFGYYRGGKKLAGDPRLPAAWPAWLELPVPLIQQGDRLRTAPRFVMVPGGRPTLAAAASRNGNGVVALYSGDFGGEISRRADVWTEMFRSDDPDLASIGLEIRGREVPLLQHARKDQQATEAVRFFKQRARGERYWDKPLFWWGEISGPLLDLATGRQVTDYVAANLNATPNIVRKHLFASAAAA